MGASPRRRAGGMADHPGFLLYMSLAENTAGLWFKRVAEPHSCYKFKVFHLTDVLAVVVFG